VPSIGRHFAPTVTAKHHAELRRRSGRTHTVPPLCSGDRHLALAVGGVPNWLICIVAAVGVST
jgi:hypothetical protein